MDVFKKNSIQLSEFKKLFYENPQETLKTTSKAQSFGASNSDWKLHARQQIGLILSKQYKNLHESFEGKSLLKKRKK